MVTTATEPLAVRPPVAETSKPKPAITYWAVAGAVVLAFMLWVWGKWIAGPYFKPIPYGPNHPPTWMQIDAWAWQGGTTLIMVYMVYRLVVRPWRRERRVPFDGLFMISMGFMWFWNGTSEFFGQWFTQNSYLINFGSWYNEIPGWRAFGEPGKMLAEPVLLNPGIYTGLMFGWLVLVGWLMRKIKQRWPSTGPGRLIAMAFVIGFVFDTVLEGFIWMPLGLYNEPGVPGPSLFPNSYFKLPFLEVFFASVLMTAWASLRYFKNDKGETLVERGITDLKAGTGKKTVMRFLALISSMSLIFVAFYNVPLAMFVSANQSPWPKSVQDKSYFTDYICGQGTDRMCPGTPGIPPFLGNDTVHLNPYGKLVIPAGVHVPTAPVPFTKNINDSGTSGR